jgi:outer membrane protein TolC
LTIKFTEQLQSHLKTAKAFLDENIIPLNDYLQTKVTLSNARLNVIKAKNAQKVAQSYLNLLLNRNLNLSIRPETDFTIQKLTKPLLFYQNKAVTLRPDLKVAITRVKQARSSIRLAQSSYYPQVALSVNYRDLSDESMENDSTSVLVTANWSIFEWNKRKWEVSAEKAQLEQAILMEGQLKQEILHEVKTAYLKLLESLKRIQTIKDSVKQARENMRINTLRYKEQVATSTDVIDAQTLLLRTEVNLTVARIDYLKALAGLEKAIGQSLPEDSL